MAGSLTFYVCTTAGDRHWAVFYRACQMSTDVSGEGQ